MSGCSAASMDALMFLYWVPIHSEVFVIYLHLYNKNYGFLLSCFYVLLVLTFWALVADVCFGPVGENSILRILSVWCRKSH